MTPKWSDLVRNAGPKTAIAIAATVVAINAVELWAYVRIAHLSLQQGICILLIILVGSFIEMCAKAIFEDIEERYRR